MCLLPEATFTEYVLPRTDLYHEDHPMHWLVLDEIEELDEAMENYDAYVELLV